MPNAAKLVTAPTREMRLVSRILAGSDEAHPGHALARLIAVRRRPGEWWMSWEQLTIELHTRTGETITREGIHRWAKRLGIPDDTRRDDGGRLVTAYDRTVKRSTGIDL